MDQIKSYNKGPGLNALYITTLTPWFEQQIKGIVSDSNNICLWHESKDIDKNGSFQNFSWF